MKKKKFVKLELFFLNAGKKNKPLRFLILVASLIFVALIVYVTGGIKFVYSHLAYLPILIGGIIFGVRYGILSGIIAGILLGPFMPLDVKTGESQLFINWFTRLLIFTTVGGLSGFGSTAIRNYMKVIVENNAQNQLTKIPNILSLEGNQLDNTRPYLAISIYINNFDTILTALGSEFSIRVMQTIYQSLREKLPSEATLVQGHNDSFWVTIPYTDYDGDLIRVHHMLEMYPVVSEVPLYIDYSLGAAVISSQELAPYVDHFKKPDGLAIAACKEKKVFLPHRDTSKKGHHRFEMEILARFKDALEKEQTFLVYHPKVDLKTNKVIGLEALVRWDHPKYGMLGPDRFLPLIEGTQLIQDLTLWVARVAFRKLKQLKAEGVHITMSINVSAVNLYHHDFYDQFVALLREENIDPREIEIEVTESSLMTNLEESKRQLKKFSALGVAISIDDYGKEYSSLAYLAVLNVQVLKIDKFFIWKMEESEAYRLIVKSTIDLAHRLQLEVNAEGVETEAQNQILKGFGCDSVQGYYYTQPLEGHAIIPWCSEYNNAVDKNQQKSQTS